MMIDLDNDINIDWIKIVELVRKEGLSLEEAEKNIRENYYAGDKS